MTTQINLNNIIKEVVEYEAENGNLSNIIPSIEKFNNLINQINLLSLLFDSSNFNENTELDENEIENRFTTSLSSDSISAFFNLSSLNDFSIEELQDRNTYIFTENDITNAIQNAIDNSQDTRDINLPGMQKFIEVARRELFEGYRNGRNAAKEYKSQFDEIKNKFSNLYQEIKNSDKTFAMDEDCDWYDSIISDIRELENLENRFFEACFTGNVQTTTEINRFLGFFLGLEESTNSSLITQWIDYLGRINYLIHLWKQDNRNVVKDIIDSPSLNSDIEEYEFNPARSINLNRDWLYRSGQVLFAILFGGLVASITICAVCPEVGAIAAEPYVVPLGIICTLLFAFGAIGVLFGTPDPPESPKDTNSRGFNRKVILFNVVYENALNKFKNVWDKFHGDIFNTIKLIVTEHNSHHTDEDHCHKNNDDYLDSNCYKQNKQIIEDLDDDARSELRSYAKIDKYLIKFQLRTITEHWCNRTEEEGCLAEDAHKANITYGWETPIYAGSSYEQREVTMCPYHDGIDVKSYIKSLTGGNNALEKLDTTYNDMPVWQVTDKKYGNTAYNGHGEPTYYPVDVNFYE